MNLLRSLAVCVLALVASRSLADVVHLSDGRTLRGEVTLYENGALRLSLIDGGETIVATDLVERIEFERLGQIDEQTVVVPPAPRHEQELEAIVEKTLERLATGDPSTAAVALYLDTQDLGDSLPQGHAKYKCYRGAGYSGIERAPLRAAWVRNERVSQRHNDNGVRRIEIDPGPPYEVVERSVTLVPGQVTSLGRIVLRKLEAEQPIALSGYVRDERGEPVADVLVSAGAHRARTDADGLYWLEGFGLEVVDLSARKRGFVGVGKRVEIRDSKKEEIATDLTMFRPWRLRLRYVIGAEGSNSFEGPGVETGVIERTVDAPRIPLDETLHSSKSFQRFAQSSHLYLDVQGGALTIRNTHAPVFYQRAERAVGFNDVAEAPDLDYNTQHCPPLEEGAVIVARGFHADQQRGVSPYCVKFLVEELSTAADRRADGEWADGEFRSLDGEPVAD